MDSNLDGILAMDKQQFHIPQIISSLFNIRITTKRKLHLLEDTEKEKDKEKATTAIQIFENC